MRKLSSDTTPRTVLGVPTNLTPHKVSERSWRKRLLALSAELAANYACHLRHVRRPAVRGAAGGYVSVGSDADSRAGHVRRSQVVGIIGLMRQTAKAGGARGIQPTVPSRSRSTGSNATPSTY